MKTSRVIIAVATVALTMGSFSAGSGQRVGGDGSGVRPDPPKSNKNTPPRSTNTTVKTVYKTRVERVVVTPTTGSLSVAARSNATILVDPVSIKKAQRQQGTVPSGEGIFVFNDLKPGRYRVIGTLDGYRQVETEVLIGANKVQPATLNFQPILYSVVINTNVGGGELKYAKEGQPLSNVTSILNRSAQLQLPAGKYVVEIRAAEFGYETLHETFSLSTDKTVLDMPLKRIALTTDTLSPRWTTAELQTWDVPAAWKPDSKKNLIVQGTGVAFPRDEGYRYYKDFKLSSSARMLNGVALSFALRARDSQNYYLLQLTGEKSDDPNTVRLFVVKNGVEQRIRTITIPTAGAKSMASGQFFTVSIKMIDFTITVEIEDSETGAAYPLGGLTDPARNFAVGAVGIAGHPNEENVIGRFVVCTGDKCLSE